MLVIPSTRAPSSRPSPLHCHTQSCISRDPLQDHPQPRMCPSSPPVPSFALWRLWPLRSAVPFESPPQHTLVSMTPRRAPLLRSTRSLTAIPTHDSVAALLSETRSNTTPPLPIFPFQAPPCPYGRWSVSDSAAYSMVWLFCDYSRERTAPVRRQASFTFPPRAALNSFQAVTIRSHRPW